MPRSPTFDTCQAKEGITHSLPATPIPSLSPSTKLPNPKQAKTHRRQERAAITCPPQKVPCPSSMSQALNLSSTKPHDGVFPRGHGNGAVGTANAPATWELHTRPIMHCWSSAQSTWSPEQGALGRETLPWHLVSGFQHEAASVASSTPSPPPNPSI